MAERTPSGTTELNWTSKKSLEQDGVHSRVVRKLENATERKNVISSFGHGDWRKFLMIRNMQILYLS